jgi:hypothetical protein
MRAFKFGPGRACPSRLSAPRPPAAEQPMAGVWAGGSRRGPWSLPAPSLSLCGSAARPVPYFAGGWGWGSTSGSLAEGGRPSSTRLRASYRRCDGPRLDTACPCRITAGIVSGHRGMRCATMNRILSNRKGCWDGLARPVTWGHFDYTGRPHWISLKLIRTLA